MRISGTEALCKTWKARSCPLFLTLALAAPPLPHFFFFDFWFFKNLLRLKINILSSIYLEIKFPAKPVMKINNLSRPKVPAPPPPPPNQMVVPLGRSVWSVKCQQTGVDIDNPTPHNSLTINWVRIWIKREEWCRSPSYGDWFVSFEYLVLLYLSISFYFIHIIATWSHQSKSVVSC